ncbi:four helix bundle protein [Autumnicola musiva]|uniref:Four helix bundle protein n=1 Tax=Autumnicola musiva TaxID=3075589 RepID=A0ABU3D1A1_9FLAO|nr:four helix bundle protein [Zunongwangia sp. F117]MDT0675313.1 four helix bundle protein [Zunongwangia sp. F117]
MNPAKENIILKVSFEFSEKLRERNKYEMASQVFRSGTSIGANVHEAQNAESRADFIHKCKIGAKEADEVLYWLLLCEKSEYYPGPNQLLFDQLKSITPILSKIISSSKKKSAN